MLDKLKSGDGCVTYKDFFIGDFVDDNKRFLTNDNHLFLLHTNIRSINANFNEFEGMI